MTDDPDPSAVLDLLENMLCHLDRLGADIAAAQLSGVIDTFRNLFDLD